MNHFEIMTPEGQAALQDVKGYAAAGRVYVPGHARERMAQRGVDDEDVFHALTMATSCAAQPSDRWLVEGPDIDGDPLTVVVVLEAGVVVVTVF